MRAVVLMMIFLCFAMAVQGYISAMNPTCYGSPCPAGTTSCQKHMKSNGDGYISITINCLDSDEGSLKTYFHQEPSSMNRNIKYESTSRTDIGGGARVYNGFRGFGRNNEIEDLMAH